LGTKLDTNGIAMAAEKILTEAACKAAKARDSIYYLNDGAGLRLRVRPDGSRTWIFRYRLNGKEMSAGLGAYPTVTLQIARAKALDARALADDGQNISSAKKVAKATQSTKSGNTFGLIAREWLDHNKADWSSTHYERNEGLLRRYLLPDLAKLPIAAIEEQYLFSVLKKVYDQGTKVSAMRTRTIAAQIFSYARATHRAKANPARDMSDNPYFRKPPVKHYDALPKGDVHKLMGALNKTGKAQKLDIKTVCALKLALYTGLRDNSIRGAKWGEIDLDKSRWTVPAERMKSRREFTLPLPKQAISALMALKQLTYVDDASYVFPSAGKYGFMAENTLRLALHRIGFPVTVHGMRSLITNVLNERGFNRDAIERQLDHQERNQVRAAYLTSNFMEVRASMMQWFADWCDGSEMSNVAPIRSAA
jgi:integrase